MDTISVEVPMTFKLRGGRKVIILPDGTQGHPLPRATIDNTMVKALARAFRWQALLENGTYGCIEDIARAERISGSFVGRIVKLALLAPDIVEMILDGRHPAALTLKELMAPFPAEWERQRQFFIATPPTKLARAGFVFAGCKRIFPAVYDFCVSDYRAVKERLGDSATKT